jgi:hypothetical protein
LLENITFGTTLSFTLTLSGQGVTSPNPSLPGSAFSLTLYDNMFNALLTTDPAGTVVTVNVNPNGSSSVETFPISNSVTMDAGSAVLPVPEPISAVLVALGAAGIGAFRLAARQRANARQASDQRLFQ